MKMLREHGFANVTVKEIDDKSVMYVAKKT